MDERGDEDYEYKDSGGDAAEGHNIGAHWETRHFYQAVSSCDIDSLNEKVTQLLNDGYHLVGGVTYATCESSEEYVQALAKSMPVRIQVKG